MHMDNMDPFSSWAQTLSLPSNRSRIPVLPVAGTWTYTSPQGHCPTPSVGTHRRTHVQSCLGLPCSTHTYLAPRPLHLLTGHLCYCFHSQQHTRTHSGCCTRDAQVSGPTPVAGTWFHSLGCPQVLAPRHIGPAACSPSPAAGTQSLACSSCCTTVAVFRPPFRHTE